MSRSLLRGATLLDTGPLVAWFDRSDQDHGACAGFFQQDQGSFVSTWPVTTEVCRLIPADVAPRFLAWVSLGGLNLAELGGSALEWMATWMRQYGDLTNALACLEPDALCKKGRVPTNAMCSSPSSRPS